MSISPLARALAVAATLLSASLAVAQPRLQPQDLLRLRSVGDVQVSRDGTRVAYTVVNNDAPGRPYSQLWIMELASGKTVRVGGDGARGGGPVWSPDSTRVAFSGRIGEQSGLIVSRADGSAPEFLAPMTGTNSSALLNVGSDIAWSPDGRRIAFVNATPGPEAGIADGDPMVISAISTSRPPRKATRTSTTTSAFTSS